MMVIAILLLTAGGAVTFGGCVWLSEASGMDNRPGPTLVGGVVMFVGGLLLLGLNEIRERIDTLAAQLATKKTTPASVKREPIICPECHAHTFDDVKTCPKCGWVLAPSLDGALTDFE
jgi:hypothetical protein